MRREALDTIREAIEAHTERRSIEELRAQGKRHVRVVSSERILAIIKAIVNDIVDREVGELTQRDRERIVHETKQQFDRVLKMQHDQEQLLAHQKELTEQVRAELAEAVAARDALRGKLEALQAEHAAREQALREKYEAGLAELQERERKAERALHKLATRHANLRTTCKNFDDELKRLVAERDRLLAELEAAREKAGESATVGALRGELEEMKAFLRTLGEQTAGVQQETLQTLLERFARRQSVDAETLEKKFQETLDASLDKITKTMEAATARPIEVEVEATDVLIDKLFDHEEQVLSSNLGELEVEVRKTRSGIAGNLAALRALRAGGEPEQDEPEPEEAAAPDPEPEPEEDPLAEGNHGPDAETAVVAGPEKEKLSESMERLKAVRRSGAHQE